MKIKVRRSINGGADFTAMVNGKFAANSLPRPSKEAMEEINVTLSGMSSEDERNQEIDGVISNILGLPIKGRAYLQGLDFSDNEIKLIEKWIKLQGGFLSVENIKKTWQLYDLQESVTKLRKDLNEVNQHRSSKQALPRSQAEKSFKETLLKDAQINAAALEKVRASIGGIPSDVIAHITHFMHPTWLPYFQKALPEKLKNLEGVRTINETDMNKVCQKMSVGVKNKDWVNRVCKPESVEKFVEELGRM